MFEGVQHSDSMPVNTRTIVSQMIFDRYFYPITPASLEPRSRILAVENFTTIWTGNAVSVYALLCDV
jgi:hypothetical protein